MLTQSELHKVTLSTPEEVEILRSKSDWIEWSNVDRDGVLVQGAELLFETYTTYDGNLNRAQVLCILVCYCAKHSA